MSDYSAVENMIEALCATFESLAVSRPFMQCTIQASTCMKQFDASDAYFPGKLGASLISTNTT